MLRLTERAGQFRGQLSLEVETKWNGPLSGTGQSTSWSGSVSCDRDRAEGALATGNQARFVLGNGSSFGLREQSCCEISRSCNQRQRAR